MSAPEVVTAAADLRRRLDTVREAGSSVGFVPTMGYLHEGHGSLVDASVAANDLTVVSVFVNPLQFAPSEDLADYPRDLDADVARCGDHGSDLVFHPTVDEVYPEGEDEPVAPGVVAGPLEGASRPTHFAGVATVVARLFRIVGPCRAYFGEKDFQQLAVIRGMVADLALPVEVVGRPTVREPDGLAKSSRNVYLRDEERRQATVLYRALRAGAAIVEDGERDPDAVIAAMEEVLAGAPLVETDYAALVESATFLAPDRLDAGDEVRLLVAARLGNARLIDNVGVVVT
ncbi:MAG: pantoate--beta-alanine ligase [Acidimicrobiaceae bacterium]|nr:pantoate--beta-alanine ligase [Acidimicrobiaceae bacterium]